MEWPNKDTSLHRKDAWTQTFPARKKIRRAQVQGVGKSICQRFGPAPAKGIVHRVGIGEEQGRGSQGARIQTAHQPFWDSFAFGHLFVDFRAPRFPCSTGGQQNLRHLVSCCLLLLLAMEQVRRPRKKRRVMPFKVDKARFKFQLFFFASSVNLRQVNLASA